MWCCPTLVPRSYAILPTVVSSMLSKRSAMATMISTKRRERRHRSRNSIDSSLRIPMVDDNGLQQDGLLKKPNTEITRITYNKKRFFFFFFNIHETHYNPIVITWTTLKFVKFVLFHGRIYRCLIEFVCVYWLCMWCLFVFVSLWGFNDKSFILNMFNRFSTSFAEKKKWRNDESIQL